MASFFRSFIADESIRKIFLDNNNYELSLDKLRICEALHNLQASVWREDINTGSEATDEIIADIDAENEAAEKFLI